MRQVFLAKFDRDFKKLKLEHKKLFLEMHEKFTEDLTNTVNENLMHSKKYRIRILKNTDEIWELTWSYSRPDGRATFHIAEIDGEPTIVWRRIGDHYIFKQP